MPINISTLLEMRVALKREKAWHDSIRDVINFNSDLNSTASQEALVNYIKIVSDLLDNSRERIKEVHKDSNFETSAHIINAVYFAVIVFIMEQSSVADFSNANLDQMRLNANGLIEAILRLMPEDLKRPLIQATDETNLSLLMWAVNFSLEKMIEMFIENGADLNLKTKKINPSSKYQNEETAAALAFRLELPPRLIAKLLTAENLSVFDVCFNQNEYSSCNLLNICETQGLQLNMRTQYLIASLRNHARFVQAKYLYQAVQQPVTGTLFLSSAAAALPQSATPNQQIKQHFRLAVRSVDNFYSLMQFLEMLSGQNKMPALKAICDNEYLESLLKNFYLCNKTESLPSHNSFSNELLDDWLEHITGEEEGIVVEDVNVALEEMRNARRLGEREQETENHADMRNVFQ